MQHLTFSTNHPESDGARARHTWPRYFQGYVSDVAEWFKNAPEHIFRNIMMDVFNQQFPWAPLWPPHRFRCHRTRIRSPTLFCLARLYHHCGTMKNEVEIL